MLAVIGCGNPARSDDGVGCTVAQRVRTLVRALTRPDVAVFDAGTDGMAVMFAARGSDALVIVDASRSGSSPGAIYEVPGERLERPYVATLNLHDFRWEHALAVGRKMYATDFPAHVTVLLVEAEHIGYGVGLSAPVAAAADRVVARVMDLIARHAPVAACG